MTVFDAVADRYHRARPRYPAELIDRVLSFANGGRVLEVGPATGVATEQLADRGAEITAVEPGKALAAAAIRNLGDRATIVHSTFEA